MKEEDGPERSVLGTKGVFQKIKNKIMKFNLYIDFR